MNLIEFNQNILNKYQNNIFDNSFISIELIDRISSSYNNDNIENDENYLENLKILI